MAGKNTNEPELPEDSISADDWAAAMAEQMPESNLALSGGGASGGANFDAEYSGLGIPDAKVEMILDIPINVTVELGRTKLAIRNLLQLAQGSVVELDGLAGEPMDVLVNGCLIAQGEVVVVNDKFGIRLTDIITPAERLRRLSLK
jgi:flagellar motor switch protein FliN/FliY